MIKVGNVHALAQVSQLGLEPGHVLISFFIIIMSRMQMLELKLITRGSASQSLSPQNVMTGVVTLVASYSGGVDWS